ncbi:hypothetical protein QTP88_022487 [Uroleucon formosanum]
MVRVKLVGLVSKACKPVYPNGKSLRLIGCYCLCLVKSSLLFVPPGQLPRYVATGNVLELPFDQTIDLRRCSMRVAHGIVTVVVRWMNLSMFLRVLSLRCSLVEA